MPKKKKPEVKKNKVEQIKNYIATNNLAADEIVKGDDKAKNLGGRPTIYTEKLAEILLNRIIEGEALEVICKDDDMPGVTTVFRWREAHKEFRKAYSRARKLQAEILGDRILIMSDKVVEQAEQCDETHGATLKVKGIVEAVKLRAGQYQWLASKFNKKLFGDHQTQKIKSDSSVTLNDKRTTDEIFESIKNKAELPQNKKKHEE